MIPPARIKELFARKTIPTHPFFAIGLLNGSACMGMRHSFASICASKEIDIYRIATLLGHEVGVAL